MHFAKINLEGNLLQHKLIKYLRNYITKIKETEDNI